MSENRITTHKEYRDLKRKIKISFKKKEKLEKYCKEKLSTIVKSLKEKMEKSDGVIDSDISLLFIPGSMWVFDYGKGNLNNKTITILSVVENHIVYKWYGKHKKRWFYVIDHFYAFYFAITGDHLFCEKRGKNNG